MDRSELLSQVYVPNLPATKLIYMHECLSATLCQDDEKPVGTALSHKSPIMQATSTGWAS